MKRFLWTLAHMGMYVLKIGSYLAILYLLYRFGMELSAHKNIPKFIHGDKFFAFVRPYFFGMGGLILAQIPMKKLFFFTRKKAEYKEDGTSVKYSSYDKLTRREREFIDKQRMADLERILPSTELRGLTHAGSQNPDRDMERLKGLARVKEEMKVMVARMQVTSKKDRDISSSHMMFLGNPGTGKTTCARIMTGFLHRYGYIKNNKVIEIDGNFLKAGQYTQKKTERIVREAFGGVLFIDEAYALVEGSNLDGFDALSTIVKLMEDHRDKFILILAGYTQDMKTLLHANEGLESRIKHFLVFDDYDTDTLLEIFISMAADAGYRVDEDAKQVLYQQFIIERNRTSFGNARTVRNMLDKIVDRHALHIVEKTLPASEKKTLHGIDVEKVSWGQQF